MENTEETTGPVTEGPGQRGPVTEGPGQRGPGPGPGRKRRSSLMEWAIVAAVAVVAAIVVREFVFEAFFIPSGSMEPTLVPGDRVVVNRLSYHLHPVHTGDIVVFRRPPADTSTVAGDLIKRVIGLPGQTLWVHNCRVYINGKQLAQPYLPKGWQQASSEYCTTWDGGNSLPNPYKVPKGDYFVMGDNRMDSDDSRFWGPLPGKYIVGRAFLEIWPLSHLRFF